MTKTVQEILDELATTIHNLSPGDIGSMDRVLRPINVARSELYLLIKDEVLTNSYKSSLTRLNTVFGVKDV